MSVVGIKGETFNSKNCQKVAFDLIGTFDRQKIKGAITISNINFPQSIPIKLIKELNFPDFVDIRPYTNARVKLLLGQDNWRAIATRDFIQPKNIDIAVSRSS